MSKFFSYFKDSYHELKLVTWPKQDLLLNLTITTVIFVMISGAFLGLADFSFSALYQWLLNLGA
ncbi:MAG: preprotein translocase subunit SecE [Candidatus Gracilibacteria bacterium]|nr:preprotein translocase subunit SecE [Candidatus Gracilibacteria bacterium]